MTRDLADINVREHFSLPPEGCTRGPDDPMCWWNLRTRDPTIEYRDQVEYDEDVHPWCAGCDFYEGPVPEELRGWVESLSALSHKYQERRRAEHELQMRGVL